MIDCTVVDSPPTKNRSSEGVKDSGANPGTEADALSLVLELELGLITREMFRPTISTATVYHSPSVYTSEDSRRVRSRGEREDARTTRPLMMAREMYWTRSSLNTWNSRPS